VVAHERAHLTGHHALIVTGLRGLAAVFPRLALFRQGLQHVSRLLEMCADDAAVRDMTAGCCLAGWSPCAGPLRPKRSPRHT